jgi:hypothetical protein
VSDKKDHNKKHYFTTVPKIEVIKVLEEYSKQEEKEDIVLWLKGKEENSEDFELSKFSKEEKAFYLRQKGSLLSKLTGSSLIDKDVLVKFKVDRFHYFTMCHLMFDSKAKEYKIQFGLDIYKSQQRTNFRLMASQLVKIQFKMNNVVFNAHDISAGGTSVTCPEGKEGDYPVEKRFEKNELMVNGKKFDIPLCIIKGTFPDKDALGNETGFLRLGIAFEKLGIDTEEELFKHINSEARAEEVKKKFNLGTKK